MFTKNSNIKLKHETDGNFWKFETIDKEEIKDLLKKLSWNIKQCYIIVWTAEHLQKIKTQKL